MNWYISRLLKEARGRRFSPEDTVRYFTRGLKGKGKGVVLMPLFRPGRVVDYDATTRRYRVDNGEEIIDVHPRNLVPDNLGRAPQSPTTSNVEPVTVEPVTVEPVTVEPV